MASSTTAALSFAAVVFGTSVAGAKTAEEVDEAKRTFVDAHGGATIAAIRIEGLKRTRPAVVEQWVDCAVGSAIADCDLRAIHEHLYRLTIFSDIDVAFEPSAKGVELVVRLEEKRTLYPVPMLWFSPQTQLAGLILVEANLFGTNKGLAVGGIYSNRGWYTLAGYNDPNIAYTNGWLTLHTFLGSGLAENEAPDGSVEQSFDITRVDVEGALGWTFWDRFSPAWTSVFRYGHVRATHVPGAELPVSGSIAIQGLYFIYSDLRFRDLYDEGLRLTTEVQHAFPLDPTTKAFNDISFDGKWAHAAPLDGFVDVRSHAFYGPLPIVFEERLGGLTGTRTLPGSGLIAADRYASLSLEYQVPFWHPKLGTASALVFGEIGQYARNVEPAVTYGGPGAGLRFYLKHIAIPAFGFDIGEELGVRKLRFTISVGYRPVR